MSIKNIRRRFFIPQTTSAAPQSIFLDFHSLWPCNVPSLLQGALAICCWSRRSNSLIRGICPSEIPSGHWKKPNSKFYKKEKKKFVIRDKWAFDLIPFYFSFHTSLNTHAHRNGISGSFGNFCANVASLLSTCMMTENIFQANNPNKLFNRDIEVSNSFLLKNYIYPHTFCCSPYAFWFSAALGSTAAPPQSKPEKHKHRGQRSVSISSMSHQYSLVVSLPLDHHWAWPSPASSTERNTQNMPLILKWFLNYLPGRFLFLWNSWRLFIMHTSSQRVLYSCLCVSVKSRQCRAHIFMASFFETPAIEINCSKQKRI